jgi:zinc transport system permease protein
MVDAAPGADAPPDDDLVRELAAEMADVPDGGGAIATPDDAPSWDDFTASWDLFRDAVHAGAIAGAVLGFLSVYVVLRRMVFLSAAVTQAAGLGVVLAFYATIHLGLAVDPLVGATMMALATAALLSRDFHGWGLSREMVLGMTFALASGGAVLVGSRITQEAHDIQSILFGSAVVVSPEDLHRLVVAAALVMALQLWWFRGFAFASFDPISARVQRVPVGALDLVLLLSIGVAIAIAARALGAMPAFALSTLPGVAAILVARGPLVVPFLVAALFGSAAGVLGYMLAFFAELPVGASQTVVAVAIVAACAVVRGVVALVRR